jgi:hypothetical protein
MADVHDEGGRQPVRWYGVVLFGAVGGAFFTLLDLFGWSDGEIDIGTFIGNWFVATAIGTSCAVSQRLAAVRRRSHPPGGAPPVSEPELARGAGDEVVQLLPPQDQAP